MVKQNKHWFILLPALFLLNNCKTGTTDEIQKVNDVVYKLIEADNRSDIKTVLGSYTDSAEFYPAGKEFTSGIDNIRGNYEKLFRDNKLSVQTVISETKIFGADAIIKGINTGKRIALLDSSSVLINDKYIALLVRNKSGEWKIDKLIWGINH